MTEYSYAETTNVGVAVLTEVMADPTRDNVVDLIGRYADEGETSLAALFVGVVNVGAVLLAGLEFATGTPAQELLQDLAAKVAAGTTEEGAA